MAIVETIIGMTKSLGLKVIAEGVEKQTQVDFLFSQGCTDMQGYFYSKPVGAKELEKLFEQKWPSCLKDTKAG